MSTREKERTPRPASRRTARPAGKPTGRRPAASPAQPRRKAEPKPVQSTDPAPEVVYLPPQPFNKKRLLLRLATVVAVVVALLLGLSVFFKVDDQKIIVSGNGKYSAWDVFQASGIQGGDNLLTFSRARAVAKIRAALPYVEDIRIGIKLPDTVIIEVEEVEVPYAVAGQDGAWWLISSSGRIIEKTADGAQSGYTRILGVQLENPVPGGQAAALENGEVQTDPEGNTVPAAVTMAQRLKIALNIAQYMELNGIIGQATTVDVNALADIQVMYGQRYQVKLGNDSQMSYKISCMKQVIDELDQYQSGILDISFTTWPDRVGFTPFDDDDVSVLQIS